MESFYGGRQGNPFIIVKRFDGVDIPQPNANNEYTYRAVYYAYDARMSNNSTTYFLFDDNQKPIEKTAENQFEYKNWALVYKDGSTVIYSVNQIPYRMPLELAEGMVQCFSKGGSSTSEVNYGEYVLIDAHTGLKRLNDLENGLVYRRGMDYENELGGAEYIGNIVGPQGESPEIQMTSYMDIINPINKIDYDDGSYSVENENLVPGFDGINYNDEIYYAWGQLRDKEGNIDKCLFGFKFPYLVVDFEGEATSPYKTADLVTRLDDRTHPFYAKWQIKVPKGIHGADIIDLEVITTKTKPGVTYYADANLSTAIGILPNESYELKLNELYDIKNNYASFSYNGNEYFVNMQDTWCTKLRYKAINYDHSEAGDLTYVDLGAYNMVEKITADKWGKVSVVYTHDEPDDNLGQLSYLLETIVTKDDPRYSIGSGHLLLLFSTFNGDVTYYSPTFQKDITGYIDLGYIKGDPGPGLHIIATFDDVSQLPADPSTIPMYEPGYAVAIETSLYIYDYINGRWAYLGSSEDVAPEDVVRLTTLASTEEDKIQDFGIWFIMDTIKFAE